MDRVQRLTAEIQQEARQGNLEHLARFVERRVRETFELAGVSAHFWHEGETAEQKQAFAESAGVGPVKRGNPTVAFSEGKSTTVYGIAGSNLVGDIRAEPHGAALSGETRAALEFLCEQLPAAIDLCRLIEEKLRLERELAERERLALVGQTAASISHNLKNPLGSIKTILQVQLESPEMPESMRAETKMILEEIGRLSAKLNQLLQFSRPAVRGATGSAHCDARVVLQEVTAVLRHEAERRGVALEATTGGKAIPVATSAETLNDIVSNLVVNALEATPRDGRVRILAAANGTTCSVVVEDNGAGIPESAREKVLQPFFTTKAQGTGLGLAIVARRVSEVGGKLEWKSPAKDGRGTRFEVTMPMTK
jgi:signal transduction histidine kinase